MSKELHDRVLRKIEADGMGDRQTRILMQGIGKLRVTREEQLHLGCAYLVAKERADEDGSPAFYGVMSYGGIRVVVMADADSDVATVIAKDFMVLWIRRGLQAEVPYNPLRAQSN